MPSRTRQAPVEEPEGDSGLQGLSFNQPLSWRVGRAAIPIADLLDRLQTLAQELRKLEQEEIDKESLRKVSQELSSANLLAHKDKGVRAWAACCIVDVLRLCAPDAPFTRNQLKDIFTCIVTSIIPALADPSNAYNAQQTYVLGSLAEVKSVVLMTDLDHPDSLIVPLFSSCFDIVSGSSKSSTGEEVAKGVEFDMTRLLVTVIDETPVLAAEVVDTIVAQFLRVDPRVLDNPKKGKRADVPIDTKQDTLLLKDYPPAYNMAKAICQACPERMTSHISQYFNNVIIDASAPGQTHGSKGAPRKPNLDDSDEEGEDIKELSKAHRLIRELWRACPEVLQNVIPQVEAELSAESIALRMLATQTIGDLAAGIGVAGPPPSPPMDPAAYPPVTLEGYAQTVTQPNILQTPISPKPFSQVHNSAYEAFLSRRQDKTPSVRAAWVTVVGRILLTSAGGSGLGQAEEQGLVNSLVTLLQDADEKVRVAAVDTVGQFGLTQVVNKLGIQGGCSTPNSVFSVLADRVKDRKPQVREHAMKILARIWAVASGDIEQNTEPVVSLLKEIPSRIFDSFYTNDPEIHVLIDRVLFEILLPLSYPPIKSKLSRAGSNLSQKGKEKEIQTGEVDQENDVDKIRVRRILTLLRGLDEKSRRVFFVMLPRQLAMRSAMTLYLEACEKYNGGVVNKDADQAKAQLSRVIDSLSKTFPDSSRASADLWKFAKAHDRRSYQLVRFSMAALSDYRTVIKAMKELQRRAQSANNAPLLETLTPLLYRSGSLIFNRSHIPAIMSLSRTDENNLASAAQEMLKQISSQNPEVLEAQVQEMCKDLEAQAPKANSAGDASTEEILKACAGFAKKLPAKLPKERKFFQALTNYALYSISPHSAKHAVSILMATADKKEMYAKELVQKCVKKWAYGSDHYLTRLGALSQLNLLAPREADEESDAIISIAVNQILLTNRSPQKDDGYKWSETVDEETQSKVWALKIIVNRLRAKDGSDDDADFREHAKPVYETLNKLVAGEGELSKKKDTPASQKSRLRLLAAKSLVKLCATNSLCDQLLTPADFNAIALMAQDPLVQVRSGFVNHLRKKLVQKSSLSYRWYVIPCLLAFEPSTGLKESTLTWLRSRAAYFSQQAQASGKRTEQTMVMEVIFSRLLSLLAYHPDYPSDNLDESTKLGDLSDLARYIVFYLQAVANEHNLSLIFHVAQRVKQFRDGITKTDEISTRLHTLSDLAQATIRRFADIYSQQHKFGGASGGATNLLQTYPGKMGVPSSLFSSMTSHREAQDVADKNFLPDELDDMLDRVVRNAMKPKNSSHRDQGNSAKKRKPESLGTNGNSSAKKARKEKRGPGRPPGKSGSSVGLSNKTRQKRKDDDGWSSDGGETGSLSKTARRRSSRGISTRGVSYADKDSDEDDMEMEKWDEANEDVDNDEEGESDDEEMQDDGEQEEEEQEEEGDHVEAEEPAQASEKENSPPSRSRQGTKASAAKASQAKKPVTTTLPTRRSSRRG